MRLLHLGEVLRIATLDVLIGERHAVDRGEVVGQGRASSSLMLNRGIRSTVV